MIGIGQQGVDVWISDASMKCITLPLNCTALQAQWYNQNTQQNNYLGLSQICMVYIPKYYLYSDFTFHQPGVASFSGPPTIPVLIAHGMQMWNEEAWSILYHMSHINVYLGRQRWGGLWTIISFFSFSCQSKFWRSNIGKVEILLIAGSGWRTCKVNDPQERRNAKLILAWSPSEIHQCT